MPIAADLDGAVFAPTVLPRLYSESERRDQILPAAGPLARAALPDPIIPARGRIRKVPSSWQSL